MEEDYSEHNEPVEACPKCGSTLFYTVSLALLDAEGDNILVQCSQCDERIAIDDADRIERSQVHGTSALSSDPLTLGDVLRLPTEIGDVPAGLYMVRTVGFLIELARCAENEDGDLASTHRIVKVTHHEIERFEHTYLNIEASL